MGMHLMREIGDRGVYANPELPDFMVFLSYEKLPWFWHGFDMLWFACLMVLFVPGVLAFVFGYFAFRSRVTGVYLSIITQALTYALLLAFFRNEMGFGGNNGLTDFRDVLGFPLSADTTRVALFVLTGIALGAGVLLARAITASKFGKVLVAVRDAESRTRFLGYRVEHYKLFVFTVSAMLAGVAGALYVPQVGIINPSEFSPANSIEIVIWVALGGRGTLVGAALGALIVAATKSWLTAALPEAWLFVLGAMFILVTIFLPKGVLGLIESVLPGRKPATTPRPRRNQSRRSSAHGQRDPALPPGRPPQLRRLQGDQRPLASPSPRASSAPSSARTAPARRRCSTSSPARRGPTPAASSGTRTPT